MMWLSKQREGKVYDDRNKGRMMQDDKPINMGRLVKQEKASEQILLSHLETAKSCQTILESWSQEQKDHAFVFFQGSLAVIYYSSNWKLIH